MRYRWWIALLAGLLVAFIATARSVGVAIDPEADEVALEGFPPAVRFGSRFLVRPGAYTLVAEKEGRKVQGRRHRA